MPLPGAWRPSSRRCGSHVTAATSAGRFRAFERSRRDHRPAQVPPRRQRLLQMTPQRKHSHNMLQYMKLAM